MDSESNILTNAPSFAPSLTDEKNEGMFLPDAELPSQIPSILSDTSVTLGYTIPKALKEAYNNSFVSLEKPEILNAVPQAQLLEHAENVKSIVVQILKGTDKEAQVKMASQILATNQIFLEQAQRQYQLYFAPGAIHQEQTNQKIPAIQNELQKNQLEQIESTFATVKNIAMKALVLT